MGMLSVGMGTCRQTQRKENCREITGVMGWEAWVASRRADSSSLRLGTKKGPPWGLAAPASSAPVWTGRKAEEGRGAALSSKSEQGGIARDLPELAKPSSARPFH